MSLKNYKQVVTSLLFLNACLAGVQIWAICTGNLSILFPLLMLVLPLFVMRGCRQVATLPSLTEIKALRWELVALKNLKFELLFLMVVTLVPLCGGLLLLFSPVPMAIRSMLGGRFVFFALQTCLVLVSCYQLVLTCDLLEQSLDLFEKIEAPQEA